MNLLVGDDDLTADKDYKHIVKRLRNLVLRKMGVLVNGIHITPALLRFHLRDNKISTLRLDYLLNPNDRQNVPLCYSLLKEIWSLPDAQSTDKPSFIEARKALQILGKLFRLIVLPYIQVNLSLHEQLVYLSAAAHLATFLYTVNNARNKAIQSLTFRDIILLVKNAYFCVAKAKINTPNGKFWIILLGTDRLESTFGLVRSMVGNDSNVDALQISTRLSHAVECLNIFEKHPEWDRGARRLKLPAIEDANGDILAKVDHINPSSWKGDVSLSHVSLVTSWNAGRNLVEAEYLELGIAHQLDELEKKGYDMTFPFGQQDISEDDEENDEPESQEVNEDHHDDAVLEPNFGESNGPLLDLEDQVAIESNINGKGSYDPFIEVSGKKVSKPRALRELFKAFFSNHSGSKNQLERVAGLTRFTIASPSTVDSASVNLDSQLSQGPILSVGDPVATLLRCEGNIFLAIVQVTDICIDHESVLEIRMELLLESIVSVQFQVYQFVEIVHQDDPDRDNADWKWNRQMETAVLKTFGSCIEVVDPPTSIRNIGEPFYLFKSDELRAIAASLHGSIAQESYSNLPIIRRSEHFPYRSQGDFPFRLPQII